MEIADEYQKLCQEIWELRITFYRQYHIEPNVINAGHDEVYTLKNGNRFATENGMKINEDDYTVFGMKLNKVMKDNCLSVGFVIE